MIIIPADASDFTFGNAPRKGMDPDTATLAQLRQQLPALEKVALSAREKAKRLAVEGSMKLSAAGDLRSRQMDLEERRQEVNAQMQEVLARLQQHSNSGHMAIIDDVRAADLRLLARLQKDVLEPMLANARLEREKGFATNSDPLLELQDLFKSL